MTPTPSTRSTGSEGPQTEAGRRLDVMWPGTTYDRLQWRDAILAIEAEAAQRVVERLPDAIVQVIAEMVDGTNGLLDHAPREVADRIAAAIGDSAGEEEGRG